MATPRLAAALAALALAAACSKSEQPPSTGDDPVADPQAGDASAPTDAPTDAIVSEPDATAAPAPADAAAATAAPKPAPTNLELLPKGWSRDRVEQYMEHTMNRGLGVECEHCHDEDDYADDGKEPKRIARDMMRMTRALDRKYFKGQGKVTCFTCHQGNEEPK